MKKTVLLSAAFLAATQFAQAQAITLTAATHMPQPGLNAYQHFTGTTNMPFPATGANVTWNFATLTPDSGTNLNYYNCVPQADCAGYGNANLVLGTIPDSTFNYYVTSATTCQHVGASSPSTTMRYTDPLDMYRFPFTYGTQFADNYSFTANIPSLSLTLTTNGVDSISGAGYGTLITPLGTYNNVLLLRRVRNFVATLMGTTQADLAHTYEWFDANSRSIIMGMDFNFSDNGAGQFVVDRVTGLYKDPNPTAVSTVSAVEHVLLVPNPSVGNTRLDVPSSFATREASVVVTDITGKTVFTQALNGATSVSIATEGWAKGLYLVRLQNVEGKTLMNKLSVQ